MILHCMAVVRIESFQVVTGEDAVYTGTRFGSRSVDGSDLRMSVRAAQHFGVSHADKPEVADKSGSPGNLNPAIATGYGMIDDLKVRFFLHDHDLFSWAISSAARRIALTMGT